MVVVGGRYVAIKAGCAKLAPDIVMQRVGNNAAAMTVARATSDSAINVRRFGNYAAMMAARATVTPKQTIVVRRFGNSSNVAAPPISDRAMPQAPEPGNFSSAASLDGESITISAAKMMAPSTAATETAQQLAWYNPSDQIAAIVQFTHEATGYSYASSIFLATIAVRFALLPLAVVAKRNDFHRGAMEKDLERLKAEKQRKALSRGGSGRRPMTQEQFLPQVDALYRRHNYRPYLRYTLPVINVGTLVASYYGLRTMIKVHPDAMVNGGALWFPDLTVQDPTLFLPILASTLFFVQTELDADGLKASSFRLKWVKRGFFLAITFALFNLPTGILCYWVPNTAFSIVQRLALQQPYVLNGIASSQLSLFRTQPPLDSNVVSLGNREGDDDVASGEATGAGVGTTMVSRKATVATGTGSVRIKGGRKKGVEGKGKRKGRGKR